MSPVANAVLGLVFVAVGAAATFLMYHLWGYPYDEKKLKSMAPLPRSCFSIAAWDTFISRSTLIS